jgi:hypothetical protein
MVLVWGSEKLGVCAAVQYSARQTPGKSEAYGRPARTLLANVLQPIVRDG